MIRPLSILAALLLVGCDQSDGGWLHGYAEGEYIRLGAPAAGWLQSVPVQRGDRVEAGALLVRAGGWPPAGGDGRGRGAARPRELSARRPEARQAARGDRAAGGESRRGEGGAGVCRAGSGPAVPPRAPRFRRRSPPRSGTVRSRGGPGSGRCHGGRSRHRPAAGARRHDRGSCGRGRHVAGEPGSGALGDRAADGAVAHCRHGPRPRPRQRGVGRCRWHRRQPAAARQGQGALLRARAGSWAGSGSAKPSICAATAAPPA